MRWSRVLVGTLLSTAIAVPSVQAQQGGGTAGGLTPAVAAPLGIPTGAQIIDVRWSGDRMGEFTILTTLPPEFRGPAPNRGPAPFRSAPTPTPLPVSR
jgi:hypothetical protein